MIRVTFVSFFFYLFILSWAVAYGCCRIVRRDWAYLDSVARLNIELK